MLPEMSGEWVEQLRSELGQLRFDLLETATRSALAVGEVAAAERMAGSLIELEPYRESGYGLLMEALALGGNVAEALLIFDRVRVMLRDELCVPPAPALTALHSRLLRQTAPAPEPVSHPAVPQVPLPAAIASAERNPFAGRAAELRRLRDRWDRVRGSQGALVLLSGEPGSARRGSPGASRPRSTPAAASSCTVAPTRTPSSRSSRSYRPCAISPPTSTRSSSTPPGAPLGRAEAAVAGALDPRPPPAPRTPTRVATACSRPPRCCWTGSHRSGRCCSCWRT